MQPSQPLSGKIQLNRKLLQGGFVPPKNVTCGSLNGYPEKILQFGEGNFLRAFFDWMVDETNARGLFGGSVVAVQPIAGGMAPQINAQEGLYTLIARGIEAGTVVETRRIITSISRALNPYEDWADLVALAQSPELRFVVSNTTEAGIAYIGEPYEPGCCPASFPAKVAALLYERFVAVGGDPSRGLVFLPCELIERNGAKLKEYVLQHANAWKLGGAFCAWVESSNSFLNTLVDRIVPGYPRAEAETLCAELGYTDQLLDTSELFHLWVIEGPAHLAAELPLADAGINVIWTDDMTPYRSRKVRMLNGAHTACVLAAFLGGINTVREMTDDPLFERLLRQVLFKEIVPALPMEEGEKQAYAQAVLERFRNPFIKHELLSISLNSISKWKVRVLPSLLDSLANTGKLPPALVFSLAALMRFYKGKPTNCGGINGERNGEDYPIRDDAEVMEFFQSRWQAFKTDGNTEALAYATLSNMSLWGEDLTQVPGLLLGVIEGLRAIHVDGMRAAVECLLAAAE
ncbi:MAG: tagaturonate reductase [Verrucomicrobia bacterium]|nr:tagaturonate reductase [Verrucomicrobiota bacterium]